MTRRKTKSEAEYQKARRNLQSQVRRQAKQNRPTVAIPKPVKPGSGYKAYRAGTKEIKELQAEQRRLTRETKGWGKPKPKPEPPEWDEAQWARDYLDDFLARAAQEIPEPARPLSDGEKTGRDIILESVRQMRSTYGDIRTAWAVKEAEDSGELILGADLRYAEAAKAMIQNIYSKITGKQMLQTDNEAINDIQDSEDGESYTI